MVGFRPAAVAGKGGVALYSGQYTFRLVEWRDLPKGSPGPRGGLPRLAVTDVPVRLFGLLAPLVRGGWGRGRKGAAFFVLHLPTQLPASEHQRFF